MGEMSHLTTFARPARRGPSLAARRLILLALAGALAAGAAGTADPMASYTMGAGSPPIVLIHTIGGDRSDWNLVAPALAKRHRLLIVDLPGHGQSAPPEKTTVAEAAKRLEKVLSQNKVTGALLVGHSYGALVALELAADHPKRAAAVVAIDAATYTMADSVQLTSAKLMLRERYSVFLHAIFERMTSDPARSDSLVAHAARVKQEVLSDYFHDAWKTDLRPRVKGMKTPVHVVLTEMLWPQAESWTGARTRLGYQTAGPAQGHRIMDSAHFIALDRPDTLVQVIEQISNQTPR